MRTVWLTLLVGVGTLLATAHGQEIPPAEPALPRALYDETADPVFYTKWSMVVIPRAPLLANEAPPGKLRCLIGLHSMIMLVQCECFSGDVGPTAGAVPECCLFRAWRGG
jgi:hypothetical protein